VAQNLIIYPEKIKVVFDKKAIDRVLQPGYLILRWDVRQEDKGKYGNFDCLWFGPFKIAGVQGKNTFLLENLDGGLLQLLVNGQYLKHFFQH